MSKKERTPILRGSKAKQYDDSSEEEDKPSRASQDYSKGSYQKSTPKKSSRISKLEDDSDDSKLTSSGKRRNENSDSDISKSKNTSRKSPADRPSSVNRKSKNLDDKEMEDLSEPSDRESGRKPKSSGKPKFAKKIRSTSDSDDSGSELDVPMPAFMPDFFRDVQNIKESIVQIKKNVKLMNKISAEALAAVGTDAAQKNSSDLEKIIDATNMISNVVRNKLKAMDAEIKKIPDPKSTESRVKTSTHQMLMKNFLDIMRDYQEVQNNYKNKSRERVERQYRVVNPNATDEEIEMAMEKGQGVFADQIMEKSRQAAALEALQYIENRHKDIVKLEQSILELHQLFVDLAILVDQQGEMIDQIEYNVVQAKTYTKEAVVEIAEASKYQKKARKKMCCILCILLIVIAVILGGGGGLIFGLMG
mmetsp:Transcript_16695/g.23203  ORF Transcript_16695/g.23203 Transcript_16695/m.23203 type:complete len:420 (+) Transcript_16695:38-1297(+)|eukprot:CAMPEP_0168567328 /NCGR_PEP_ID=MMETSP0413-20121227/14947_1 /TAXON_ID=136452 /ORGANISM="Filamoeba nolandi, Strain NC-AS-23-1" /LENGTH=419 /DNA_ID=CAMNT_0008599513 /DNA_START=19 /DNA_END=1278 /DNA_ORIENTATION=-